MKKVYWTVVISGGCRYGCFSTKAEALSWASKNFPDKKAYPQKEVL